LKTLRAESFILGYLMCEMLERSLNSWGEKKCVGKLKFVQVFSVIWESNTKLNYD